MKAPAAVAALSIVLAGGTMFSGHPSPAGAQHQTTVWHTYRFPLLERGSTHPVIRDVLVPMQTTPTDTATPSPSPSPTVTSTPTPTYPDGATVLQTALNVYGGITAAHVKLVTKVVKPDVQSLTLTGTGNAWCKGPSLQLKVKAVAQLLGTKQKGSQTASFAQKGKTTLKKGSKKTAVWKKVNSQNVTFFGFPYPVDNPLICPNSSQGSGGSSSGPTDTFKDVVNQGPEQFQGTPVWHIHLTDVRDLGSNGTIDIPIDLLVDQAHSIPYVISQTVNDVPDDLVISDAQTTTKVGEKYSFKMPKAGKK